MDGVFRIVHGIRDLGVAKSESFSNFGKFFGEIVIPVDPARPVRWEIGFAHSM